jgi:D-beta-D-heptose 7-phosphate kinase / D-beta-D-heptose 1-phosphate adenosyltransferase
MSAGVRLVVVGDALLDRDLSGEAERLSPDAAVPVVERIEGWARPGGAALAAVLAAAEGRDVTLVTAIGADDAGEELRALLAGAGVTVVDLGLGGATPEKIRVLAGGRPVVRLDRGGRFSRPGAATASARAAIGWASGVLVADYGRGIAAEPGIRAALAHVAGELPVLWDPHPRGPDPVPGVALATPNRGEAAHFAPEVSGDDLAAVVARARALRRRWEARAVCVTLGAGGALVDGGEEAPAAVPAQEVAAGDACGAGDRFASRAAGLLAEGARALEAVCGAVEAASAWVRAGGALAWRPGAAAGADAIADDALAVAGRVRRAGGTVVATGGCFDILHAGHVSMLQAARALGDCLVVCLNGDASVRRLKGPARPVVPQADRAAVLLALGCVDAVLVFDEDTPETALGSLRPHVWAKGGDYRPEDLPEAAALASWGGQAVILPFVAGRSTTRIIEEVTGRGS